MPQPISGCTVPGLAASTAIKLYRAGLWSETYKPVEGPARGFVKLSPNGLIRPNAKSYEPVEELSPNGLIQVNAKSYQRRAPLGACSISTMWYQ